MKVLIISKFNCQSFPLNENAIEVSEEILNEIGKTKCFDVENNCVIDYDNSKELEKEAKQKRIEEIKIWFEEYDNQVKQYERCKRLGIEFDKDMVELDNQADAYQKELRKLDYKKQSEYN